MADFKPPHDVSECAAGYRCAHWCRVSRGQAGSSTPLVYVSTRTDIQRVQRGFKWHQRLIQLYLGLMAKMNWDLQKMLKTKKKKRKTRDVCTASPEEDEGKVRPLHCRRVLFPNRRWEELLNKCLASGLPISEGHWQIQRLGHCDEQVKACVKCWLYLLAWYLFPFLAIYPNSSIKAKLIPVPPN